MESNKLVLRDSPVFINNFSDNVILKTVGLIKEHRCTPEEIITIEDMIDDCSIFFIEKGSVEIFIEQNNVN